MSRYSCGLDGICQSDIMGGRLTQAECQEQCRPLEGGQDTREIVYEVMTFNPEQALHASPDDRVRLIRRMTGVTVSKYRSYAVLRALITRDYFELYSYHLNFEDLEVRSFGNYLRDEFKLDDFDFMMLRAIDKPPIYQPDWSALRLHVDEALWLLFHGKDAYVISQPVLSRNKLIELMQWSVPATIQGYLNHDTNQTSEELALRVAPYWEYLLNRYGVEELPYQHLIR
jgi:hypothetical protein